MSILKVALINDEAIMPDRAHSNDSWIDFYVPDSKDYTIAPSESVKIPLGVKALIPKGFDLTFTNKSGIASKTGLIVWACLIDVWYTWELIVNLINTSDDDVVISAWQKIVQWVIRPIEYSEVQEFTLEDFATEEAKTHTTRWDKWFGSTWV